MPIEAQICPNCGAPLHLVGNQCSFCQAVLAVTPTPAPPPMAPPPRLAPADPNASFAMLVDDVFAIKKRGTVVTGRVESGTIRVGDAVLIEGAGGVRQSACAGVEMFRKQVDAASAGDVVGLLLRGVDKGDVTRGDRLRSAP